MENKDTEKEGFVGMSDTMKHYELEKLVEELRYTACYRTECLDQVECEHQDEKRRSVLTLADKQGYMRGVEEALRIVKDLEKPKSYWSHPWWREDEIAHNNAISQAHDAISKLKEIWS